MTGAFAAGPPGREDLCMRVDLDDMMRPREPRYVRHAAAAVALWRAGRQQAACELMRLALVLAGRRDGEPAACIARVAREADRVAGYCAGRGADAEPSEADLLAGAWAFFEQPG